MTAKEFINTYGDAIVQGTDGFKLFPSVKAAQMALETGWGASIKGNNAFGIKAAGSLTPYWKGSSVGFSSTEYVNGVKQYGVFNFRSYPSISDSIADHSYFLLQEPRYRKVFEATTPEAQAQALQSAGYATDPNYASKLISIIRSNNLTALDQKKKS